MRKERIAVILVRPEKPENIGLVARNMKNTGFENLRIVKEGRLDLKSYVTAVHAQDILDKAKFFANINEATQDLELIFASTSKKRKNFSFIPLKDVIERMLEFPLSTKVGFLFGNERTGLTSKELQNSNFRFTIPQAAKQPSYNLASAVLITLFQLFTLDFHEEGVIQEKPLSRKEQMECLDLILNKLKKRKFIHRANEQHMTERIYDLLGRLSLSSRDRNLLLALFSKGL